MNPRSLADSCACLQNSYYAAAACFFLKVPCGKSQPFAMSHVDFNKAHPQSIFSRPHHQLADKTSRLPNVYLQMSLIPNSFVNLLLFPLLASDRRPA